MITRLLTRNTERATRPEGGFTLLEMVIAVILLVLITGAISAAFVSSLNATSATKTRVNETNDAQLIAGFFTRDAQAAGGTNPATGTPDTFAPDNLGVTAPANNGCSSPGTSIMGFKWIDLTSGTTYESNYSYVSATTTVGAVTYQPQQFLRTVCSTPTGGSTSTATSVLANNVVTTTTGSLLPPFAYCDSNAPPATPCPALMPNVVHMTISDFQSGASNVTTPDTFTLTASLRPQANAKPDTSGSAVTASLILFSGSGNCINTSSQAFQLTTYGTALLSGCSTNVSKLDPFGQVFAGNCANWPAGTCTPDNTPVADPFQAKINAGLLTAPPVNCNSGPPAVGGDGNWQPGTYPQDPQAGGVENAFDPGVYVFCNGLSGNVTANLSGGSIGGTFFYFAGGSYNCQTPPISPSCSTTVLINPPTSGQYNGLAIWQPSANNSTINFSKGLTNITGTVYAPSATVNMKNGSININQLVAYSVIGNPGNPTVRIGPPLGVMVQNPLAPGTAGQQYPGTQPTMQAIAVDGTGVYSGWTITGVTGLTISNTGVIGGTVNANVAPGTYTVTIGVNDNDGEHATVTTQITINQALTISGALPSWTVNKPGYPSNPLTAGGGSGTGYQLSWTGQPPGLSMAADGTISGTPSTPGTYNVAVTLTDSIGDTTTVTYNNVVIQAAPTITSFTLKNKSGGTAGVIQQGDQIIAVFSSQMKESTFCSAWTNDTADPTISVNGGAVTVVDGTGTTNDQITVAVPASSCSTGFNFDSVDLGSNAYVSGGNVVFGTNGTHTTFAWNHTTQTLTITLGAMVAGGGTVGSAVASSTATYTVSPLITDTVGGQVSNGNPFTPTGSPKQQF